tara:strand:- start:2 stop:226 length:225 start_codon:yes stop_codon:yes gene_type:complete
VRSAVNFTKDENVIYIRKDSSMIYAIKVSVDKSYELTYFRAPASLKSGLTGFYSTGAFMVPFGPFKRISFELFQ